MVDDFDANKFLAELTIAVTKGLVTSTKQSIQKIWSKLEYGITLNPEESKSLKDISESEFYRIFKKYLGNHWSINLIKVGLYISDLDEGGNQERAREIQGEVFKKYGHKGVKITHLASVGILIPVMNYIIDLKLQKDASIIVLSQEFDKILSEWDTISIPVSADLTELNLREKILQKMNNNYPIFFVFSSGRAARNTQLTLAKMNNEQLFSGKYLMTSKNRVNPISKIEHCLWTFDKIEGSDSIISTEVNR